MPYRQELVTLGNGVAGYVPVPRYCGILHDCQNTMGIAGLSSLTATVNTDTRFTRPGKPRSVKLTVSGASPSFKVVTAGANSGGFNMAGAGDLTVWVWCPWTRGVVTATIDICGHTDGTFSARYAHYLRPGLNRLVCRRGSHTTPGSAIDWTTVAQITCSFSGVTSGDVFYVCGIDYGRKAKGMIINTVDDNRISCFTTWQPLLDARNIHATLYMLGKRVAQDATYGSQAQMQAWHDAGHDISYQSWEDSGATDDSLTYDQLWTEYAKQKAYSERYGYLRNGELGYMGYNRGQDSAAFIQMLKDKGCRTGRLASMSNTGGDPPEHYYSDARYGLFGYLVSANTTAANVLLAIDQAVEHGLVLQLIWHGIVGSVGDATTEILTSDATTILNYQVKYRNAGMLDICSMTEAMSRMDTSVAPAITKTNPATIPGIQMAFDVTSGNSASLISLTGTTVNSFTSQDTNAYSFAPGASLTKPTLSQATNNGKTFTTILNSSSVNTDGLYSTFSVAQPCHIFLVARLTALAAEDQFFFDGIAVGNRNSLKRSNSGTSYFGYAGTNMDAGASADATYWIPDTNWHIVEFVANGDQSKIFVDGSCLRGSAGTNTLTGLTIGNRYQGGGTTLGKSVEWTACYVFKTDHTYSGYDYQARAYLADRFGITLLSDGRQ